ncbi:PTS sugar transporter subunit IIA [Chitinivorax sp. B]|uniref:PTS sugar transporter subunit IIA n=1 Tax=Chitinivorax sp. B TaxID=2502235 RepID=UPI0010F84EC4|nr:PTS sugar transporter subunit IIA [Chitinivorax sp. B]
MNDVSRMCSVDDIQLDVPALNKHQLFEAAARFLEQRHNMAAQTIVERLSEREALGSTALGQGVAVPHARVPGLQHAMVMFMRPRTPIPFDAPDGKPVTDVLVLLIPDRATDQHLQLLACAAEMFADRRFRDKLRACGQPEDVHRVFTHW